MSTDPDLPPGSVVELNDARIATVRFVGPTAFAPGIWVGVEFDDASGKNDGSVQGERYFNCAPGRGMFLRTSGVSRVVEVPKSPSPPKPASPVKRPASQQRLSMAARPAANGKTVGPSTSQKARPSSIGVGGAGPARPTSRPSSIASDSRGGSGANSPIKKTAPNAGAARPSRLSMAPPTGRRASVISPPASTTTPRTTARFSLAGPPSASLKEPSVGSAPSRGMATNRQSLPPIKRPATTPTEAQKPAGPPSAAGAASTSTTASTPRSTAIVEKEKEIEELQAKLRISEKKRVELAEKQNEFERVTQDKERFELIIQKLQSKLQPQQKENAGLKKALKEAESRMEEIESIQAEHDTVVEMATLDREMAEEHAEAYKTELDSLKQRFEEMQLENEILKEENEELGQEMSPEERTSQGWLQLERENERLRQALLRLRDMSQEQEEELREHIKSLEDDALDLGKVKEQYDDTKARLLECEADMEDLRQQLEVAQGSEEMIEALGEKNESLNATIDDLRLTIEDLQSLKELNDELDLNHVENEKQLQELIDFKDSVIIEQNRRTAQHEEALAEQEYTITRFRELVLNLQSDLEDLRASKEITETEAYELSSKSKAIMDLNRQLQVSATSSKVKTIDTEIRKLEAQEAAEHLSIVQLFLPEAFYTERDSVLALLRFKRIGFKANLLHSFIKEKVNNSPDESRNFDDNFFEACDVLDKLVWMSTMSDRFVNSVYSSSLDQFARFEGALHELEPVERALNGYIENLKRDELHEKDVAEELHRSMAVISHLADSLFANGLESYADSILMRTLLMQSHLETTATALSVVKTGVQSRIAVIPEEEESDMNLNLFVQKAENMIAQSRSAKVVVSKTARALQELKSRSLSLEQATSSLFEQAQLGAEELAEYSRKLGEKMLKVLNEEGRTDTVSFQTLQPVLCSAANEVFGGPNFQVDESEVFSTFSSKLRALVPALANLSSIASDLDHTAEFERPPAPWVLRSRELAASKLVSVDAEDENRRLKEEVAARARDLRARDEQLEERGVKIELLEARTRDAGAKSKRIRELESALEARTAALATAEAELKARANELDAALAEQDEAIHDAVKAATQGLDADARAALLGEGAEPSAASRAEVDRLRSDIAALERTVRYLRQVNRREQRLRDNAANSWLREPLLAPSRTTGPREASAKAAPKKGGFAAARDPVAALAELARLPAVTDVIDLGKIREEREKEAKRRGKEGRLAWKPSTATVKYALEEEQMRWREMWGGRGGKLREEHGLVGVIG